MLEPRLSHLVPELRWLLLASCWLPLILSRQPSPESGVNVGTHSFAWLVFQHSHSFHRPWDDEGAFSGELL